MTDVLSKQGSTKPKYPVGCKHFKDQSIDQLKNSLILKETCVSCFDSQDSKNGLNLCLKCLTVHCLDELDHYSQHYALTQHGQYLNIKRTVSKIKESHKDEGVLGKANCNSLEFEGDTQAQKYEHKMKLGCLCCNLEDDCESSELGECIAEVLKGKPDELSEGRKILWRSELEGCVHTNEKPEGEEVQVEFRPPFKCEECEINKNLWLCSTCGYIGCGRKQYGGIEGNSHALSHYEQSNHSLSMKVGTILESGADTFCYVCGENRIDPYVSLRLKKLGINPKNLNKTELSTLELNVEKNVNIDVNTLDVDKNETALKPLSGLIGIENLGNTCYCSSTLQILLRMTTFRNSFSFFPASHKADCETKRIDCLPCQIQRIVHGCTSGRYINKSNGAAGLSPLYLLMLYSKKYPLFEFNKQQDASEFLQLILDDLDSVKDIDVSEFFSSIMLELTQSKICGSCDGVALDTQKVPILTVNIPTSLPSEGCIESQIQEELNKTVDLYKCLECTFTPYSSKTECPSENKEVEFRYIQSISKYPRYLIMSVNRFLVVNGTNIYKHNAKIVVPQVLDLKHYSFTPVSKERLMASASPLPVPDHVVSELYEMGFSEESIIQAYKKCKESTDICELATAIIEGNCTEDSHSRQTSHDYLPPQNKEPSETPIYHLRAFISHKGPQINSGHYVSHFFSPETATWVTANDTKLNSQKSYSTDAESGYIYLFEQHI